MGRKGIPFILKVLSALTGFAFIIILVGWTRPLTLLFGVHTISLVSIFIAGFLCVATGSSIVGRLADLVNKPVILLTVVLTVMAVFLLVNSLLFQLLTEIYSDLIMKYYPGAFGTGVLRFLLTFAYLLIPLTSLGGVWPLLFRLFIRNIDHSGKYMSAAVFWISVGMLCSIFLTGFIILPNLGVTRMMYLSAFIFILMAILTYLWSGNIRKRDYHSPYVTRIERAKKSLRFKKKRIVLETGAKLTRAMLNGYAFQSFAFFSLLIVSYRILIRYSFIHYEYFILLFLAVVVAGIALGSILYKLFAEKPANKFLTLATLQVISGFGYLFSFAFFKLISGSFYDRFSIIEDPTGVLARQLILLSLFLLIPSIIHGISVPLAGKLYPRRLPHIGKSFGKLGSLIFLSICSAALFTPFIIIPLFGLQIALFSLALLVLLSGIYLISRDSRLIRVFRISYALAAVILFIAVAGLFQNQGKWQHNASIKGFIEGSTATVVCRENDDSSQFVYLDGDYLFGTDRRSREEQVKSALIPFVLNPQINAALVTGFGTGLTSYILNEQGIQSIYITEAYPEIIKLSSDLFSSLNNDILTGSSVDVSVEDSRSFLIRSQSYFDLITSGIDHYSRFPGEFTQEYYKICFDRLTSNGTLCQVIPVDMINKGIFKPVCKSAVEVFGHVSLWYLSPGKFMMLASKNPLLFDYCRIKAEFSDSNRNEFIPDGAELISHLIMTDAETEFFTRSSKQNKDDFPYERFLQKVKGNSDLDAINKSEIDFSRLILFSGDCSDSVDIINRISRLNRSVIQQVSPFSLEKQQQVVDFSEPIGSPIQQYL